MRWIKLYATTPSGKTTFCCKYCGSVTPTPGKDCHRPPQMHGVPAPNTCRELEELEQDHILHPLRRAAILRSITVVKKVREAKTDAEAVKVVQKERGAVAGYIKTAIGIQTKRQLGFLISNWWILIAVLDDIYREVRSK